VPVACSTSALTGQEGLITFQPAGTQFCLEDFSDFDGATDTISVPTANDYRNGDEVVFKVEGTAKLDTALTAGTGYFVVNRTNTTIQVAATSGGAPISLNGDGGLGPAGGGVIATITPPALPTTTAAYGAGPFTGIAATGGTGTGATFDVTVAASDVTGIVLNAGGTGYVAGDTLTIPGTSLGGASPANDLVVTVATASAITAGGNTPGAANHIAIDIHGYDPVCQVREFSIEISREELDVTTLPCSTGGGSKYASFRSTQAGYASGTGSLTVYFTDSQTSLANRLLANTLLKSQEGASVKLYVNAVAGASAGTVNDAASLFIEADISITSMSLSVNPDDPTSAELAFSITNPKNILGAVLS
jgi:hypothetical protein